MSDKVKLYGNLTGYIEECENGWKGWIEGHDNVTIIESSVRACYDTLNSEAWYLLNKDSHNED